MKDTFQHFLMVPFTGLGLYGGYRGARWLRNRIQIFKQFVVPSLIHQTNKDFTLWLCWRPEERNNQYVLELKNWLATYTELKVLFTYGGILIWDDKYPDEVAKERLATAVHLSLKDAINEIKDVEYIYTTLQPSDDCYRSDAVALIHKAFEIDNMQAFGFAKGYICNYQTLEVSDYNPTTNPPFYTIKFPKKIFTEPQEHVAYAPIKSHEYVADHLKYAILNERCFLVGCHGENVSTYYNHPFKGNWVDKETIWNFGLMGVQPLTLPVSLRKKFMRLMPYKVQRKLRYWFGECLYSKFYEYLRS